MNDEVLKSELHYQNHSDTLTHKLTQPSENAILDRNAELRRNEGVIQDLGSQSGESWGRMVASVPMIMFEQAIRNGYELNSKDAKHASDEMFRFLQSEEGKQCLVREKL